jgi:hypothetical protein
MARLLRDSFAGVHATKHPSQILSIPCATPCTAVLLFCSMNSRHKNKYMCRRGVQQREVYARLLTDNSDTYWGYHHSIYSPLLYFMHVFIGFYLCSAGSIRRGGGIGKYVIQCIFATQPDFVYLAQIFYRYCDCRRINRNMEKFVGEYS